MIVTDIRMRNTNSYPNTPRKQKKNIGADTEFWVRNCRKLTAQSKFSEKPEKSRFLHFNLSGNLSTIPYFAFWYSAKKNRGKSLFLVMPSYETGSQDCIKQNPLLDAVFR